VTVIRDVVGARELFEDALRRRGLTVVQIDGEYEIRRAGGVMRANIDNVSQHYIRTGDKSVFDSFIAQVLNAADAGNDVMGGIGSRGDIADPTWDELRYRVYWALEARAVDTGDGIAATVSRDVRRVLVWTEADESRYTFITPTQLETWGVDVETVTARADANQARLLDGKTIECSEIDGMQIGMIPISTSLKASSILAANFKSFVGTAITWPVYVVIPCRDFALIFSQRDDVLIDQVGQVAIREFRDSDYPICTEIFAIDDAGIKAIGRFEE
jgi:hypothetical protein